MKSLWMVLPLLILSACQQPTPAAKPDTTFTTKSCHSRVCTREYDPVCATIEQGGRTVEQSFGNPCSVCSDSGKIIKVSRGACGSLR
ncbi:hypothetical protein GJV52_05775 [Neisseria brasiliensis]|uniref:hypothetical protein n=1 Tax=Neisseria TaxID=482 RepID=UPI000C27CC03|nr:MULTISPECIES: hypothetical protein [Neisseria]PJO77684.1 hypothetical protein CWC45_09210 [Neisseria sp. N177_16]QGL25086.1 hypothetical protein GJV52_05775 [Neisseria brasiliensis]